jgi:hypothetical protein
MTRADSLGKTQVREDVLAFVENFIQFFCLSCASLVWSCASYQNDANVLLNFRLSLAR